MALILIRRLFFAFYVILVVGVCLSSGQEKLQLYKNYVVYEVFSENEEHLNILRQLGETSDSLIFPFGFYPVDGAVHVVVAPHKIPDFLLILSTHQIKYKKNISNLQQHLDSIDAELESDDITKRSLFSYNWRSYKSLQRTYTWMRNLVTKFPNRVELLDLGDSYEGRKIYCVKISLQDNKPRPGIFVEAGIHGREWIAPATATFIINALLKSDNAEVKDVAQNYDWYIVPHANPDGYEYSRTTDRLWRKTRKPHEQWFGADPNRNWSYRFGEIGVSRVPHDENYAGPKYFSENETMVLSQFITSKKGKIQVYVSLHSFAQMILYPYGYTSTLPENANDLHSVAEEAMEALIKPYGTIYTAGPIYTTVYPAAGTSIDWAYGEAGIKMAFTYELRPAHKSVPVKVGMQLPTRKIEPTGTETLTSLIAMIKKIKNLGYFDTST